jgi:hypothetical protein
MADFIAMTRSLQADPELSNKIAAGRLEDIAPCTACGTCLDQSIQMARRCRINAAMGTKQYTIEKVKKAKKVVVVGGGPAGMEAARVAKRRLTSGLKRNSPRHMPARKATLLFTRLSLLMATRPRGVGCCI